MKCFTSALKSENTDKNKMFVLLLMLCTGAVLIPELFNFIKIKHSLNFSALAQSHIC